MLAKSKSKKDFSTKDLLVVPMVFGDAGVYAMANGSDFTRLRIQSNDGRCCFN